LRDAEIRLGSVLGPGYGLERIIDVTGAGAVYEAVHEDRPEDRFAVKVFDPKLGGRPELLQGLRREADLAALLGGPHVVRVFDVGEDEDGAPYIVLEMLDGEDLGRRIARAGRLTSVQTASLLGQLTKTLEAAHAAGIVHGDLRPSRLFFTRHEGQDDFLRVLGFGAPRTLGALESAPPHAIAYLAPEQIAGAPADRRADVFAVGAMLYESLTGTSPFLAPTAQATLHRIANTEPAAAHLLAPDLPDSAERVLARAMAKSAEDRHGTMAFLRDEFMRALGLEVPHRPPPLPGGGGARPPPVPGARAAPPPPPATPAAMPAAARDTLDALGELGFAEPPTPPLPTPAHQSIEAEAEAIEEADLDGMDVAEAIEEVGGAEDADAAALEGRAEPREIEEVAPASDASAGIEPEPVAAEAESADVVGVEPAATAAAPETVATGASLVGADEVEDLLDRLTPVPEPMAQAAPAPAPGMHQPAKPAEPAPVPQAPPALALPEAKPEPIDLASLLPAPAPPSEPVPVVASPEVRPEPAARVRAPTPRPEPSRKPTTTPPAPVIPVEPVQVRRPTAPREPVIPSTRPTVERLRARQLPGPRPTGRRGVLVVASLAAVVAIVLAFWMLRGRQPAEPEGTTVAAAPPVEDPSAQRAATAPEPPPTPEPARAPTPVAPAPRPTAPTAAAPPPAAEAGGTVSVRLLIRPASARVVLDGIATKDNPLVIPRADQTHKLSVASPGYYTDTVTFRALVDGEVAVTLRPEKERAAARPRSEGKKGVKGPVETEW
jgi:eukaryotic-like serine/threonine-protein kinase